MTDGSGPTDSADEIDALRLVDPVDVTELPSATSARAQALLREITMNEPVSSVSSPSPAPAPSPAGWRPRWIVAGGALAVAAALAIAVGVVVGRDEGAGPSRAAPARASSSTNPPTLAGSCVAQYSLATLADREVAFAGTVASVDGDSASFDVQRWYRGGSGASVTLRGAAVLSGITSAGGPVLAPGARLLVSGDGGFAWSCGFTRAYTDADAQQWADAFAG